jgi:hypothetical protein
MTPPDPQTFLKSLLNKFLPAKVETLEYCLPKELYTVCKASNTADKDPALLLCNPHTWLLANDPTWIEQVVVSEREPLRSSLISAMPEAYTSFFAAKGMVSSPTTTLTDPIKEFLLSWLYHKWTLEAKFVGALPLLPKKSKEQLLQNELSLLVKMDRKHLLALVDLLVIHDLTEEVRHIVDKKILQSLLQQLSGQQQRYLRICLRQKIKGLQGGFGVKDQLREARRFSTALHKRGLLRLAQALSGLDSDFVWYIVHTLDLPRAKFVLEYYQPEEIAALTPSCRQQIQHVFQFLKTDLVS